MLFPVILMFAISDCGRIHKIPINTNQRDTRHAEGANCHGTLPNALQKKTIEKTSNIAQKAAQEAKAASEAQNIAGQQAARQVLNYTIYTIIQNDISLNCRTTSREMIQKYLIYNKYILIF